MSKTIIKQGRVDLGNMRNGKPDAEITWELREGQNGLSFSAQGGFWNSSRSDYTCYGQVIEDVQRAYPKHEMAKRVCQVWKKYNLNDMSAGTPDQEKALEAAEKLAVAEALKDEPEKRDRWFYNYWKGQGKKPNWNTLCQRFGHDSYYEWACATLKTLGLYEVPVDGLKCSGEWPDEVKSGKRGYRYGERWVFIPLPQEIIDEIKSW